MMNQARTSLGMKRPEYESGLIEEALEYDLGLIREALENNYLESGMRDLCLYTDHGKSVCSI